MNDINLTVGHIARHTPHGAGAQGRDAAIVDIAQDLLLRHLHGIGVLEALTFKGGTALRKLYAGNAGRFSLDLDFSSTKIGADPDDALTTLIVAVDGLKVGPFSYARPRRPRLQPPELAPRPQRRRVRRTGHRSARRPRPHRGRVVGGPSHPFQIPRRPRRRRTTPRPRSGTGPPPCPTRPGRPARRPAGRRRPLLTPPFLGQPSKATISP